MVLGRVVQKASDGLVFAAAGLEHQSADGEDVGEIRDMAVPLRVSPAWMMRA